MHKTNAFETQDIGDFMWVDEHAGGSMRNYRPGKLGYSKFLTDKYASINDPETAESLFYIFWPALQKGLANFLAVEHLDKGLNTYALWDERMSLYDTDRSKETVKLKT